MRPSSKNLQDTDVEDFIMQKRAEPEDLYAERNLLNTRVIALETDIAAAESRERTLQAQLGQSNDELLASLNDLVALGNLLRNEEQKCAKLATDHRVAQKGVHEREIKLKKSYAEIASLRKKLETEVQGRLDIRAEKQKADKKLIALRVRHEMVNHEGIECKRLLKLTRKHLERAQINSATVSKILEEMGKRKLALPILTKQSELFAAIPGSSSRRWQQFCFSLAQDGIFDPESYLALRPDVAASGVDPLVHFLTHGLSEQLAVKKDADL